MCCSIDSLPGLCGLQHSALLPRTDLYYFKCYACRSIGPYCSPLYPSIICSADSGYPDLYASFSSLTCHILDPLCDHNGFDVDFAHIIDPQISRLRQVASSSRLNMTTDKVPFSMKDDPKYCPSRLPYLKWLYTSGAFRILLLVMSLPLNGFIPISSHFFLDVL